MWLLIISHDGGPSYCVFDEYPTMRDAQVYLEFVGTLYGGSASAGFVIDNVYGWTLQEASERELIGSGYLPGLEGG